MRQQSHFYSLHEVQYASFEVQYVRGSAALTGSQPQ